LSLFYRCRIQVPAVGSMDRRLFPYAMRRLRFADKTKRNASGKAGWASPRVVREVLNGTYPPFAAHDPQELSYLAYVDAVGRAKDELVHGDDQAFSSAPAASALAQFGFASFGLPGFEGGAEPPPMDLSEFGSFGDATDVWSASVESVGKAGLAQAAVLFQQALHSGSAKVHGSRRITRRDLSPVLQAMRPGLSEGDVAQLCDLAGVSGRHGVGFADVVVMCGYVALAATTLGGLPQVARDHAAHAQARAAAQAHADAAARAAEHARPPAGLLGSLGSLAARGGALAAQHSAATLAAASAAAHQNVPGARAASASLGPASDFFGGAFTSATQAVGSAVGQGLNDVAPDLSSSLQSDLLFSVEDAVAKAHAMAGQAAKAAGAAASGGDQTSSGGGGGASGPYENKRVAAKLARQERERAAAAAAAAEAARGEGAGAMARAAAAAAMDPLFQKQVIGNWFKAKAGTGQVTWRENLKQVCTQRELSERRNTYTHPQQQHELLALTQVSGSAIHNT
jgi:hypothetical protein